MRIRKRFPTASVPLADPKLNRSVVVQVQPHTGEQNPHGNLHFQECKTNSQPSDPPNQPSDQGMSIADDKPRWVSHGTSTEALGKMKQKDLEDDRWVEDEKNSNDIRKECTLNAEVDISLLLSSSSSSDRDGRWGEGDKVVPLKKRKGGLEGIITKDQENNTAVINTKWKSKTNKKCLMQNGGGGGGGGDDDELQKEKIAIEDVDDNGNISTKTKKKKKKRGNVIMEGSRCSRVNGRGWRCCQQTLVGYSLCEHHLGKGRLRSMSSVRNRAMANNSAIAPKHLDDDDDDDDESSQAPLGLGEKYKHKKAALLMDHDDHHEDGDDNDEKPSVITTKTKKKKKKKKKKLGTVKARSMSSLLGQTDNIAVVAANNPS